MLRFLLCNAHGSDHGRRQRHRLQRRPLAVKPQAPAPVAREKAAVADDAYVKGAEIFSHGVNMGYHVAVESMYHPAPSKIPAQLSVESAQRPVELAATRWEPHPSPLRGHPIELPADPAPWAERYSKDVTGRAVATRIPRKLCPSPVELPADPVLRGAHGRTQANGLDATTRTYRQYPQTGPPTGLPLPKHQTARSREHTTHVPQHQIPPRSSTGRRNAELRDTADDLRLEGKSMGEVNRGYHEAMYGNPNITARLRNIHSHPTPGKKMMPPLPPTLWLARSLHKEEFPAPPVVGSWQHLYPGVDRDGALLRQYSANARSMAAERNRELRRG